MAAPTIETMGHYSNHQKYSVNFFGENYIVTVTMNSSVINQWICDVFYNICNHFSSSPLVVGVGVQWTSFNYDSDSSSDSYHYDTQSVSYNNSNEPADTLQLSVGKKCLIIQLRYCHQIPYHLRSFLGNSRTKFVGVWNSQDTRRLARSVHELEIGKLLDIRQYVKDSKGRSIRRCSFEEIVKECMGYEGVRLEKEISMSDWSNYNLDQNQILQALVDVYVCYKLAVRTRL